MDYAMTRAGDAQARPDRANAVDMPHAEIPLISSDALLRGARRVRIEHDGAVYTLHLTRQNKLLLTK